MNRRVTPVLLACVALVACGDDGPGLRSGKVTDKDHNAAWTSFTYVSTGKTFVMVPHYWPEEWELTVENCDVEPGKCVRDTWNVDAGTWSTVGEGDWITRGRVNGKASPSEAKK